MYGFLKETDKRGYTTVNVKLIMHIFQIIKFNTKTRNNWNRHLKEISVRILL